MSDDIAKLGIAIDSSGVNQGAADLDRLTAAGEQAEAAAAAVGQAGKDAAGGTAALGKASADASKSIDALAESEEQAASRIQAMVKASLEKTEALQAEIAASREAASASRSLGDATTASEADRSAALQRSGSVADAYMKGVAERAAEVKSVLASIDTGAGSMAQVQSQTDKLTTLWAQGRLTADEYSTAIKKLDAAEASLAKSAAQASSGGDAFIARLKDQAATAGKTTKEILEYRAAQLGVSGEAAPFIEQIGKSTEAMHGFSLQSGAARRELGVLARELASGNYSRASSSFSILAEKSGLMATLMSPLAIGIGAVAAGLGAFAAAAYLGHQEQEKLNAALILTGNYAGTTSDGLHSIALQAIATGGSLGVAKDAVLQLAASGKFTSDQILLIGAAAVQMEAATGQAVEKTVAQFEELAKSPVEASIKLNEQYHYLTLAVYEQIAALEKQGDAQGAADLAEKTYAASMSARTSEIKSNVGIIESAWNKAKTAVLGFWDAALNIGKTDTLASQLADINSQLGAKAGRGAVTVVTGRDRTRLEAQRASIQAQIDSANATAKLRQETALLDQAAVSAKVAIDKQTEALDKDFAKKQALAKLNEEFTALYRKAQSDGSRISTLDNVDFDESGKPLGGGLYAKLQKDIESKYKEKGGPRANENGINSAIKDIQGQYQEQERALKQTIDNTKAQYDIGLLNTQQYLDAQYNARKDALTKELALAQQQEQVAGQKKSGVGVEEAKNLQKKIRDEQLANEQKYTNDSKALREKDATDLKLYISNLDASYATRQQAINNLVAGAGLGDADKDQLNRINQVQQDFDKQVKTLADQKLKGSANGGIDQAKYDKEYAILKDDADRRISLEETVNDRVQSINANGWNGATRYMQNYRDSAKNAAAQVESAFSNATKGLEDAFVNFVSTGKLSFSSLADAVIADLARMQAKAAISGLFSYASQIIGDYLGQSGGYQSPSESDLGQPTNEGAFSMTKTSLNGARASGGRTEANGLYQVNENGPELLSVDGKDYLMMGSKAGMVTSNAQTFAKSPGLAAAGGVGSGSSVNVQLINQSGTPLQAQASVDSNGAISVILKQIKSDIANDIGAGTGPITAAFKARYGMKATV